MKTLQFTNMELAELCGQLALLMKAGVGQADGLYLLAEEEKNAGLQKILSETAKRIEEGIYLSTAFRDAACFPSHMVGLLEVGEQVGRTEETFMALSRYYEDQDRMNRRLRSALTYPSVLLLMMAVVIVVLLSKVLPVFEDVYASLGGNLSGIAGGLLTLGNWLGSILPILGILLALLILLVLLFVLIPVLRSKAIRLWQQQFGDRGISRKMNDARFAQALSMAFQSGLPFEECVSLAGSLLKDCPAAVKRSQDLRALLDSGEDLAGALNKSSMLPPSACKMLALGMRSGTGDATLEEISRRLSEDAQEALEAKISMIEPALVLITSLLVGAILLSVMLPLMHIMKAIG